YLTRLAPQTFAEGKRDDAEPPVLTEHELRGGDLGVHDAALVGHVERPARFQPAHEAWRGLERPAAVEQVAQSPAGEVLRDPEPRGPPRLTEREVDLAEIG